MLDKTSLHVLLNQLVREKIASVCLSIDSGKAQKAASADERKTQKGSSDDEITEALMPEWLKLVKDAGKQGLERHLLHNTVVAERGRRCRALVNPPAQLDLFVKLQLEEQFAVYANGNAGPIAKAVYDDMTVRREEQIKNMREANRAFEREEVPRQVVWSIMKAEPDLTYEEACVKMHIIEREYDAAPEKEEQAA